MLGHSQYSDRNKIISKEELEKREKTMLSSLFQDNTYNPNNNSFVSDSSMAYKSDIDDL